jgi:membrane protease YdiL (CAAX protease family)
MGFLRTLTRVALIRLILSFIILAGAYIGAQIAIAYAVKAAPAKYAPDVRIAAILAACGLLLAVYVLVVRLFERRRAEELAAGAGAPQAIGGAILGFVLFCAVYAILMAMGVAHWGGVLGVSAVAPPLLAALLAGVGEELAVRGGFFRILEDSMGSLVALVASAILFGLLHAMNKGATPISTAAIALEAGLLLAAAYMWTRNLWLPIGLHFGWNFTEGGVFGAAVSGGASKGGVVKATLSGDPLLTGGAFGPEASVVAVGVSLAVTVVMLVLAARAGRWKPLRFRMMLD